MKLNGSKESGLQSQIRPCSIQELKGALSGLGQFLGTESR